VSGPEIQRAAIVAIQELTDSCPGLLKACVTTLDGTLVAALDDGAGERRIAAMAGTLCAVASSITSEVNAIRCRTVVIDAEAGKLAIMVLPKPAENLALAVSGSIDCNIGLMLFFGGLCANQIAAAVQELRAA
jgi:predicted regulator of Ras-like GTPase activity (Roadblock/LC7/MglB family)